MLARSPNSIPENDNNLVKDNSSVADTLRLVEKKFKFPFLPTSGPNVEDLGHYAGYYLLPNAGGARMFYFFFESRNDKKNDPIVIWLSGGPGVSGSIALFYENGPFHIAEDLSLIWIEYGWDKVSNIIYVDQPIGTGFSYTNNDNDKIRDNQIDISNDLYNFLQEFFQKHPEFIENEFFITGQSYAGHYAPALTSRILQGNNENKKIYIKIKGFAVGNGLTNTGIQYPTIPRYAWHHEVIKESNYLYMKEHLVPDCESSIEDCDDTGKEDDCITAYDDCIEIVSALRNFAGNRNFYDIRKQRIGTSNYDFSNMEKFLNKQLVKKALGVEKPFVHLNETIYDAMIGDYVKNLDVGIPDLLKNDIKVLIYVGDQDLICNWVGNLKWVSKMEWDGKKGFKEAPFVPFLVDGVKKGWMSSYGPLTFIRINKAGHMVPMDQPRVAFHMIRSWMKGEPIK
ncbi:serine carboxypeptidase-like [Tripterygium wilfordii]|uniref:serine carboxypeptidase-like n=1 Tax=Tripterygium wilfordii TaxID=458696 RepID=UPI0018F824A5|nr:serine carboxypeptidase-like [Tripterygium wilfordii]